MKLLGSGKDLGCSLAYEIQEDAGGIAQALGLAKNFVGKDSLAVILGDNIYEDNFKNDVLTFEKENGARIFLKEVQSPERFGVAELQGDKIIGIEEKPLKPKTNYAVTGFYLYENGVFDVIGAMKPSARGELEITDVNNYYIEKNLMKATFVNGNWTDAGTFESLFRANILARNLYLKKSGLSLAEILKIDEEMLQ